MHIARTLSQSISIQTNLRYHKLYFISSPITQIKVNFINLLTLWKRCYVRKIASHKNICILVSWQISKCKVININHNICLSHKNMRNLLTLLAYNKWFKTILKFSQFMCKYFSTIEYTKHICDLVRQNYYALKKGFCNFKYV